MRANSILLAAAALLQCVLAVPLFNRTDSSNDTSPQNATDAPRHGGGTLSLLMIDTTAALAIQALSPDDFATLEGLVLDDPTPLQAEFIDRFADQFLNITSSFASSNATVSNSTVSNTNATISDDVKAAIEALPMEEQQIIIAIAIALGESDDQIQFLSGGGSTDDDNEPGGDQSDSEPDSNDDAVVGGGDGDGDDSEFPLQAPTGATPAAPVVEDDDDEDSDDGSGNDGQNPTSTPTPTTSSNPGATQTPFVLNPITTTTPVPTTTTHTHTHNHTTHTSTATPTHTASYWYTEPSESNANRTIEMYLRCINKSEADALITSLENNPNITQAEIAQTESEIGVYQVGSSWVRPSWCGNSTTTNSNSTNSTTMTTRTDDGAGVYRRSLAELGLIF